MANPLSGVESWLYHLGDITPRKAAGIGASDADLVVIDSTDFAADTPRPYSPADLAAMRGPQDKLIVSYLSIGEAETYRPYWQASWQANPPGFLDAPNPEWPDNVKVRYWDPAWQQIVLAQVDDILDAGFDGLYLDLIDAFQHWEDKGPQPGIDYRQEMADLVARIDSHADARLQAMGDGRDFVIIGQNGEELLTNPTFRAHLDGLAKEDLRFYYPNDSPDQARPVPDDWYRPTAALLQQAEAAGIEVFVVEYLPRAAQAKHAETLAAEAAWLRDQGIPLYVAQERDLLAIYPQPANPPVAGPDRPEGGGAAEEFIFVRPDEPVQYAPEIDLLAPLTGALPDAGAAPADAPADPPGSFDPAAMALHDIWF